MKQESYTSDFCVVGGGLAGVCAAIVAARQGLQVVLIQDRPVLGGNASSEVRLWALGATSHLGNNNRWSREGGVIDEIVVENLYRNPEGNPVIFDTVLLDWVLRESNIKLLLNTAVHAVDMQDKDCIKSVTAFNPQNSTQYCISAPLFCDASGDGVIGDLSQAVYRMGAEPMEEFGERFAPSQEYGSLMGHSLFFYSKDTGKPVHFTAPDYALKDITRIPRYRQFKKNEQGCMLWWIEYGGRLDTVHDTEKIKWELWRIVYGVWNHIKNSGEFAGVENMTLEWVGTISGKRESRRFEGDTILIQQDIVEQRRHDDAVSYGGWAIDLHPADGIYSNKPGCDQWHAKGVYQIPYRCMYSRTVDNLFLAGRLISASHVACGSSRVMMTCAHNAQAVGMAAARCQHEGLLPRDVYTRRRIKALQQDLLKTGHYIPGIHLQDPQDIVHQATIRASSRFRMGQLACDGKLIPLDVSMGMLIPLGRGLVPKISLPVTCTQATQLTCELRISSKRGNFTPDVLLAQQTIAVEPLTEAVAVAAQSAAARAQGATRERAPSSSAAGANALQTVDLSFDVSLDQARYAFVCLKANSDMAVQYSRMRVTGIKALGLQANGRVARAAVQKPDRDIGVDTFEFWIPARWPDDQNLALTIEPALDLFGPDNVRNGINRPVHGPNAWVAELADPKPTLTLSWERPRAIRRVELTFDTDTDHPMETVLMGHPFRVVPSCVRAFRLLDSEGRVVHDCRDNHQTRQVIQWEQPVTTDTLRLVLEAPDAHIPAALFELRCYE